jgi:phage-related protein
LVWMVNAKRNLRAFPEGTQKGEKFYVLHAFQKKSKRGIETPKQDVDLIVQRYKEAKELAKHET